MPDKSEDRDPGHAMFGFNEREARQGAPEAAPVPSPPANPQYVYVQGPPPAPAPSGSSGVKMLSALVVLLLVLSGVNLYLLVTGRRQVNESLSKQADELNLLTRRMNSSDERYAALSGRFEVTAGKLHLTEQELSRARSLAVATQKQLQQSNQQLGDAIAKKASADELNKAQADANAKIGGLSTDLAGTRKDLEAALAGTKGELTGAIARTHDELVELAHRTDRDYFEFNLAGKGARQKVGTVVVELARTNPKKNQFTVNLFFDDKRTERKDKAANEPVYFYATGASSALELVVNKVAKNSVAGYLSAPKGFFPNTPNVLSSRPGG
jgi:hypothetical protein